MTPGETRPEDYARLYEEARESRDRLLALAWTAAEAQAAHTEDELLRAVCLGAVRSGLSAHAALRQEPDSNVLSIRAFALRDASQRLVERIAGREVIGAPVNGTVEPLRAALGRQQTSLVKPQQWIQAALPWLTARAAQRLLSLADLQNAICAPIGDGTTSEGVLVVWGASLHEFDRSVVALLGRLAGTSLGAMRRHALERERVRLDGALLLARTAAHELNNALSVPVGYADLLSEHPAVKEHPQLRASLQLIRDGAQHAAETVQRLQHVVRLAEAPSPLGSQPVLDLDRSTVTN